MNIFKKILVRTYQKIMYVASYFLSFKEPELISGEDSFDKLCNILMHKNKKHVLLVTDEGLHKLSMDEIVAKHLAKHNISYTYYYDITANPTIDQVENGVNVYNKNNCDCIVVIGGGSAMDASKIIAARVTNPKKSIKKMKGLLKVTHKLPLLIAIPTTAGTGSETTLAAVISNPTTKEKFPIEDPHLIPKYAILNPKLLVNLPPHITSTTGMDALTHAIEAFIGKANTKKTKKAALKAIKLTFENLKLSYDNPTNLTYRENMQKSAYYAGVAFTRAYVGNVHAIAHSLGGFYHVPHGLANAIILPIVLKQYDKKAYKKYALIYDYLYPNNNLSTSTKAKALIEAIDKLNKDLNISNTFANNIKDEDIPSMVNNAYKEAIPLYPTPMLWDKTDFTKVYKILQKM